MDDQQIKFQELQRLIDPYFVLFGKSLDENVKIQHRVEVIDKQIVVHQDKFSTQRFNEILKRLNQQKSDEEEEQAIRDRIWEEQYQHEQQNYEDEGWQTQEQQQRYLGWNQSPMKNVGVMNIESEYDTQE